MIEKLIHRCIVRTGPAEGNKVATEVTRWNYNEDCEYCGQELASLEDLTLHMYEELTK